MADLVGYAFIKRAEAVDGYHATYDLYREEEPGGTREIIRYGVGVLPGEPIAEATEEQVREVVDWLKEKYGG